MAELVRRHLRSREGLPASFMNDALIATSCRLEGVTLITRNERDFAAIAKVEPVSYVLPWPP